MEKEISDIIEKIHKSDLFLDIYELGCGSPVSHLLCQVPGASKTLNKAVNSYSKENTWSLFKLNDKSERIVSIKSSYMMGINASTHVFNNKVKKLLICNFQVGNYNDVSTHGYFVVTKPFPLLYGVEIYHISIHESLSRSRYIEIIGEIGINLLGRSIGLDISIPYVDGYYEFGSCLGEGQFSITDTISLIEQNKSSISCAYLRKDSFNPRIEDLFRETKEGVILYKGSFNPLSSAHEEILKQTQDLFPNYKSAFCISTQTFDKQTNIDSITERVSFIQDKGYDVIITNVGDFESLVFCLKEKFKKEIILPLGWDTWGRLYKYYNGTEDILSSIPATFVIFDRNNEGDKSLGFEYPDRIKFINYDNQISSTKLREQGKIK